MDEKQKLLATMGPTRRALMHHSQPGAWHVQITGNTAGINLLLQDEMMREARRCELYGRTWIELHEINDAQVALAVSSDCRVHQAA